VSADIKETLYAVIDKIGKEKIRIEVISEIEMSERRCNEILEECKKRMTNVSDEESFANLCEALLHFLLTASLLPSERKVTWRGVELDLVIPSLKILNKTPENALVIQIIKCSRGTKKLKDARSVQPHDVNIWIVSPTPVKTHHRNYYIGSTEFPYSRIIIDINHFLARKGDHGLKLLHGQ
jgi:hypothetical protein